MEDPTNKKVGTTPLVSTEDLGGSRVHGVTVCKTVIVNFLNGRTGKDEIRIGIVIPGGEVYFMQSSNLQQSQKWLRDAIIKKLESQKSGDEPPMIDIEVPDDRRFGG